MLVTPPMRAADAFCPVAHTSTTSRRITASSDLFSSTTATDPGFVKTISEPGSGKSVQLGDIATLKYTCYLADDADSVTAPFAKAEKQKMVRLTYLMNSMDIDIALIQRFFVLFLYS